MISGRKNLLDDLHTQIDHSSQKIWFHCASLGEFEQARPLIELIKEQHPEIKIILSFFSPSGYEIRKEYKYADHVCYLPFDSGKNARKFINIVKPDFAVFVKYEFWYGYIDELYKQNIPLFLISAIFRKSQLFFKPYGGFFLGQLKKYRFIFLQDAPSQQLLNKYGINNTLVCGDTRIDRVYQISKEEYSNEILDAFSKDKFTIVAGSTYSFDEKLLKNLLEESSQYNFIIAPHETDEANINRIMISFNGFAQRFSHTKKPVSSDTRVIIIDTIGLLSKIYRYADITYVGGGFGKGIHNILEAAVYGIPVIFGPKNKKFKEAFELINNNTAYEIKEFIELKEVADKFLKNPELLKICKERLSKYFSDSIGASSGIYSTMVDCGLGR